MVHHRSTVGASVPLVNYYVNQARGMQYGGSLPYFAGIKKNMQSGHGLGSFFGSVFSKIKNALPWFFKTVAKNALQTGANVASDLIEGKNVKESLKERGIEGAKAAVNEVGPRALEGIKSTFQQEFNQSGSGRRYRTLQRPKKVKRLRRDIFD